MPDTSLRSLVDDLASPDPAVRDDGAYATLTRLVRDGDLPVDDRSWLGDAMVQRLRHERAEARSFAPLVLASLVAVGDLDEAWIPAVTRWFCNEQDLRGHDPELGWVHTVAHGADFFGACGAAGVGDPAALLDALARRMVEPTGFVWRDQEEDRLACAVALVLARDDVDGPTAVGWLDHVRTPLRRRARPDRCRPRRATRCGRCVRCTSPSASSRSAAASPSSSSTASSCARRSQPSSTEVTPWSWRPPRMGK